MKQKMIAPFSNGDEYSYWTARNCAVCPYSITNNGQENDETPNCEVELLLMMRGDFTDEQRLAIGDDGTGDCTSWRCNHKKILDAQADTLITFLEKKHARDVKAIRNYWVGS